MSGSFFKYLDQRKVHDRIETAADLILRTGFPIDEFHNWYCEYGVYLPPERIVLEDFWADTAKGALTGAAIGTAAGGVPGAFVGGALGGFMGGSRAAGRGIRRWLNPNGYRISAFKRNKDEVVGLLHQMLLLTKEMRNDSNYAKTSGKSIHNPNFEKLLDATITYLSRMDDPKLVGSSATPSPGPTRPSAGPAPTPGPKDLGAVAGAPEFTATLGEIAKFAAGFGVTLDPAYAADMAKNIFDALDKGTGVWPGILDAFKKEVTFTDADAGYQALLNKLDTDPRYGFLTDKEATARRFYFDALGHAFGKGLTRNDIALEALKEIDTHAGPAPKP